MRGLRFGRIIWVTATTLLAGGVVACSGVDTPDPGGIGGSSGSSANGGSAGSSTGGASGSGHGGTSGNGGSSNGGTSNGGSSNGGTSNNGGSSNGGTSNNNNGGTAGDEPDAGFEPDSGTDPDAGPTITNLVANFDAEAVTIAPWIAAQAGAVAIATDQFHSGSQSVVTVGRDATWKGVGVDLFGLVDHGKVYDASVYARISGNSSNIGRLSARATCDSVDKYKTIKQLPLSDTSWTELSGTLTMWTEEECTNMTSVLLFVENVDADLQIYADDMVVMEQAP